MNMTAGMATLWAAYLDSGGKQVPQWQQLLLDAVQVVLLRDRGQAAS